MYDASVDEKWNMYWAEHKPNHFDEKDRQKKVYAIDTPPPFTSGTLHIGNVLGYAFIDFTARYKRMKGFNVLYPQGWDTQGFPTEKVVEKKYGISLSRTEFYEKCAEISRENIKAMKAQMYKLGFSPDDKYEYVTMSPEYRAKVQLSLIMMHDKKMLYRGSHPVEWCPKDRSAIAHAETEEKEEDSQLIHIKFEVIDSKGKHLTIATGRPELLHACVAVAVNSGDKRYKEIIGKKVRTPIFDAEVDIIGDENVDMEFGTGAEMVCTFGDKVDRDMYYRHKLKLIDAVDESGILKNAKHFTGMKLATARVDVVKELEEKGFVVKKEPLRHMVKVHDRCGTPIEMIMSSQWFIKIIEHKDRIIELANEIKWMPEFTKRYLEDWANFIEWDWIISRNRVFGTAIPFWYCESCDFIAAPQKESLPIDPTKVKPPVEKCPKCGTKLVGESATCDVWIDSSITPLVVAGWPDNKELFSRAFPAAIRFQGTEIIRTWAFYTIFRSWAIAGNKPFEEILVNGMVLAPDGKRMHKSKGNGISTDELTQKYPSDAIRLWAALSGTIGKDKPFLYNDVEYAKSFITKLFNSSAFVETAVKEAGKLKPLEKVSKDLNIFDIWMLNRLNAVVKQVTDSYDEFNFFEAANCVINFYWHEFCDYYIESVKHRIYSKDANMEGSKHAAAYVLGHVLDTTLKLLAPITPHTSEELHSQTKKGSIFKESFPEYVETKNRSDYTINGIVFRSAVIDVDYESAGALINKVISDVRKAKAAAKKALNFEISSININVPAEYYTAVSSSREELMQICKSKDVVISKGSYSVEVKL
ncbi:MAG: valine--tRNA ligase [Candidatus Micrarchaeaceae archaeon]